MAIMIPERPRSFAPASQEGLMFDALQALPDTWYVFHSFKMVNTGEGVLRESECDFVIFNREKGIVCLEAKAGSGISYQNGEWLYSSGTVMSHDGPFRQAANSMYRLRDRIKNSKMRQIVDRCKMLYGVWFPGISNTKLQQLIFPEDADKRLVLTTEALNDPEPYLENIFSISTYFNRHAITETDISEAESNMLIRGIFCPEFNVFPSASFDSDLKNMVFHRLLKEQSSILNFLEDQQMAVINGAAGTGKTMIAAEKARRHAADGEKVLFLCYNVRLKNYLETNYSNANIDFLTIAGLACKLCKTAQPDYEKLQGKLEEMYFSEVFPYQHIVIDEGQDFGFDDIEEGEILDKLRLMVEDKGTFYVFYDRLQLIQGRKIPSFIEDADCKLTLYRNCRNTENIATTSLRPISERKPKLFDNAVKGVPAKVHYCDDDVVVMSELDSILNQYQSEGFKDVVILTVKTEADSVLSGKMQDGKYRKRFTFSTCRKFKGLEAEVVVLVDVDRSTFDDEHVLLFYVGASRARTRLEILTQMTDEDCRTVLQERLNQEGYVKAPRRKLASALNASASIRKVQMQGE